jgi:hypothetical protein
MPNTGDTTGQEPNPNPNPTTPPAPAEKADPWEGLPDEWAWTKEAVNGANREAASRRVALRDLEERTKDAKTPEEFNNLVSEFTKKQNGLEVALERERAARKHKLADDVLEFLTATDAEEIEKQATKLAGLKGKIVHQPAPSGGVTPSAPTPKDESGRDAWRAYKASR